MPTVLFAAPPQRWDQYKIPLQNAFANAGLADTILTTQADPVQVDYIIHAPNGGLRDFTPFRNLKAVLGLWAGVEDVVDNPTIKVPLARMVDHGLTEGMVEWVVGHVLRHHLGMDAHINGQDGRWRAGIVPPLARDRTVAILGLGVLGQACAKTLAGLNFRVVGWARAAKHINDVETFFGTTGLHRMLAQAEIVIVLLPNTPQTQNILNADRLARLPKGAVILNPGRGSLIDDSALVAALDGGHIAHATLDVFRTEPLPPAHPFWAHPKVTVTPHIASETRASSAAHVIAENIRRGEAGEPFLHLVDRVLGY